MILVTGGFGFIGSRIIKELNSRGEENIVVVDDLTDGTKFKNLADCRIADFIEKDDFYENIDNHFFRTCVPQMIFHQGAISSTTEWNGNKMMLENYQRTVQLAEYARKHSIPISIASSASVYGNAEQECSEGFTKENPLNMYAYSKMMVDRKVSEFKNVQCLRYFNVYGNNEEHKGNQASPITQFKNSILETGQVNLFEGSDNIYRDFICVDDVAEIAVKLRDKQLNGVFNVGTGVAVSFAHVANVMINKYGGRIIEVPFPEHLKGRYQYNTVANINKLKYAGVCPKSFTRIEDYV